MIYYTEFGSLFIYLFIFVFCHLVLQTGRPYSVYRPRLTAGQHQGYGQHLEQSLQGHQENL